MNILRYEKYFKLSVMNEMQIRGLKSSRTFDQDFDKMFALDS